MPHVIVIAGSNGSGKSTAAPAIAMQSQNEVIIGNETLWKRLQETYGE